MYLIVMNTLKPLARTKLYAIVSKYHSLSSKFGPTNQCVPPVNKLNTQRAKKPPLKFTPYFTLMSFRIAFLIYSSRDFIRQPYRTLSLPRPSRCPFPTRRLHHSPPQGGGATENRGKHFSQVPHFARDLNST